MAVFLCDGSLPVLPVTTLAGTSYSGNFGRRSIDAGCGGIIDYPATTVWPAALYDAGSPLYFLLFQKMQCQFGVIPVLYYVFDYLTRVYTDLLSSGAPVVVEFMPFICCGAYLVFLLYNFTKGQEENRMREIQKALICRWHSPCVK